MSSCPRRSNIFIHLKISNINNHEIDIQWEHSQHINTFKKKKTIHICLLSVPSFPVLLWLKPSLLSTSPPHGRTHKIGLRTLGGGGSGRGTRIVCLDAVEITLLLICKPSNFLWAIYTMAILNNQRVYIYIYTYNMYMNSICVYKYIYIWWCVFFITGISMIYASKRFGSKYLVPDLVFIRAVCWNEGQYDLHGF